MPEEDFVTEADWGFFDPLIRWYQRVMDSHTSANLLIVVCVLLTLIPAFVIGLLTTRPLAPVEASQIQGEPSLASGVTFTFSCSRDKYLSAIFSGGNVRLSLSDGRQFALPQVLSASLPANLPAEASAQAGGARYANPDESFVFWNKGNAAFIEENGTVTYVSCLARGG